MEFSAFLDHLAATARSRSDVVGLAAFGSTADRARADEWSDHDFAWVTTSGAEDGYRLSRDWLPDPGRIVLHVVEHHGGVKVVYDDGHLAEFGVTTLDGLGTWEMNRATAIVDPDGSLQEVLDRGARATRRPVAIADEIGLAMASILVGVGRVRRGEILSGGASVRGETVAHLLRALGATTPGEFPPLDALDPHRRVEQVHPEVAAEIAAATALPVEDAGRSLLAIAERLAGDDPSAHATADAVRRRFGWCD